MLVPHSKCRRCAAHRKHALLLRRRSEGLAKRLDLRKIHAIVGKGATREFARLGIPDASDSFTRTRRRPSTLWYGSHHSAYYGGPSVHMQLEHIFASDSVGRRKVQDKGAGVKQGGRRWRRIRGVQLAQCCISRLRQRLRRAEALIDLAKRSGMQCDGCWPNDFMFIPACMQAQRRESRQWLLVRRRSTGRRWSTPLQSDGKLGRTVVVHGVESTADWGQRHCGRSSQTALRRCRGGPERLYDCGIQRGWFPVRGHELSSRGQLGDDILVLSGCVAIVGRIPHGARPTCRC